MELTYIKQSGEPVGDGGDQYTGLDRFGRVVDQRWLDSGGADMERVDYGFTPASNRQWRQNRVAAGGQDEYYTYDGIYQVAELQRGTLNSGKTGIAGTPSWQEDFTYDPIGNWDDYLTKVSGVTNLDQSRTHNKANETTAIDGSSATVGEDPAGNMVKVPQVDDWSSAYDLKWDAWNRLVEVVDGSTTVATYAYDGKTRRVTKETDSTRHYYYSDQWQIMEERVDSSTTADRQFVWGQRYIDDLVLRDRGDERLYVLGDYFNPTAVADPSETVLERYGYNAFGLSRVMAPDFSSRTASLYDWETRYAMYRWDEETGLYQVRYRYLHPALGRWVSRDPSDYKGGHNLCSYVRNQATNKVDLYGLIDVIISVKFGAVLRPGRAAEAGIDLKANGFEKEKWTDCLDGNGRKGHQLTTNIFAKATIYYKAGTNPEATTISGRTIAEHESLHVDNFVTFLQNYSDLSDNYKGKCICKQECINAVSALLRKKWQYELEAAVVRNHEVDCEDNDPSNFETIASCEAAKLGSKERLALSMHFEEAQRLADSVRDECDGIF